MNNGAEGGESVDEHMEHGGGSMPGMHKGGKSDVGIHGMLLFGEGMIYLSHLPMFGPPHNFQVLLRVTMSGEDTDPQSLYLEDRAQSETSLYTFVPEEFALSGLISEFPNPPGVTSFKGSIFRGHFERGGTELTTAVTASVDDVVHFRKLDPEEKSLKGQELEYLCFGGPGELFLSHSISSRPSFDHIVQFRFLDPQLADLAFPLATPVDFSQREDSPEQRLEEGEEASGFFRQAIGPGGTHGFRAQIQTIQEVYLEIDELT